MARICVLRSVFIRRAIVLLTFLAAGIAGVDAAHASCSDGVQNGGETGVDCGGSCLLCDGQTCTTNSQCSSGACTDGACAVIYVVNPSTGDSAVAPNAVTFVDPAIVLYGSGTVSGATVFIETNYNSATDSLLFTTMGTISGSWNATTGKLTLTGEASMAEYQAALRTVKFSASATAAAANRTLTITLGANGLALTSNGHFYEYISYGGSDNKYWPRAKYLAEQRRYFGLHGYLATITTAAENAFVAAKLGGQGWMGSSDANYADPDILPGSSYSNIASPGTCTQAEQCNVPDATDSSTIHLTTAGVCYGRLCKTPYSVNNALGNTTNTIGDATLHTNRWRWVTGPEGMESNGLGRWFFGRLGLRADAPTSCTQPCTVCQENAECNTYAADGTVTAGTCTANLCGTCDSATCRQCTTGTDCASGVCTGSLCQQYSNWGGGEPNNSGSPGGENYGHFLSGAQWNDFNHSNTSIQGYVVEYGGMPTDPQQVLSGQKVVRVLLPTCFDSLYNGTETDLDCGGSCLPCGDTCLSDPPEGKAGSACECTVNSECSSGVCSGTSPMHCAAPACNDGVKNGSEADVDCGGGTCGGCSDLADCVVNEDCASQNCTGGLCRAYSCEDSHLNGSETDVDCGGPNCGPCGMNGSCVLDSDCASNYCSPFSNQCSVHEPVLTIVSNPYAVGLDGTSDYLSTNPTPNSSIAYSTTCPNGSFSYDPSSVLNAVTEYTISFWIRPGRLTGQQDLVGQDNAFEIALVNGTTLEIWNPAVGALSYNMASDLTVGVWAHVGITGDATIGATSFGEVKVYVNGVLKATLSHSAKPHFGCSTKPVTAGAYVGDATNPSYFQGDLDEISIWSKVSTAAEVSALQTQKLVGNEANLLAYWAMDAGTGTTVVSSVSTTNNFQFVNTPSWVVSSLGGGAPYPENAVGVPLKPWMTLTDLDSTTMSTGVAKITGGFRAGDVLAFTNDGATMGNVSASYNSGTGLMSLTSSGATATLAEWVSALRAITYASTSDDPGTGRTITWGVDDGATASSPQTSVVVIAPVNDAPTLTTISQLTGATEDTAYTITFEALAAAANEADPDNNVGFRIEAVSTGTVTKGGVAVTPGTTLIIPGESFVWTPAANANGSVNAFTVKAWDGTVASATAVQVTAAVTAVNDPPVYGGPASFLITEDTTAYLTFGAAGFVDVDAATLTVTLSVPDGTLTSSSGAGVTVGGSATSRTFTGSPAALNAFMNTANWITYTTALNADTTRVLTVAISDSIATTTASVNINHVAVNDAPTISDVTNQTISEDGATAALSFTIGDIESATATLTMSGISSNTTLIPNANIVFGGAGASRNVTVTPAANANGIVVIALTVTDPNGATKVDTFEINISAVNDAPGPISAPASFTVTEDVSGNLQFTGTPFSDIDSTLTVTLSVVDGTFESTTSGAGVTVTPSTASNSKVFVGTPAALNAYFLQAGWIQYKTAPNATGSRTLNIHATDGGFQSTNGSTIFITAVNDTPVISPPASFTVVEDTATVLTFDATTFVDVDTSSLTITLEISDGALQATSGGGVTVGGTPTGTTLVGDVGALNTFLASGQLSYLPASNNTTARTFLIRASDGQYAPQITRTVNITTANDAPTLAIGAPFTTLPSIALNGTNQYFASTQSGPGAQASSVLNGRTAFTLSWWINPGRLNGIQSMVAQNDLAEVYLWDKSLEMWTEKGTCSAFLGSAFPTNTWTHLAITADTVAGTCKIYANGVLKSTQTITTGAFGSSDFTTTVGAYAMDAGSAQPFQGKFSEISIWSVAKSGAEIAALGTAKLSGGEANLLAYWPLTEGSGTTAANLVAGANAGTQFTLYNSPTWDGAGPSLPVVFVENGAAVTVAGTATITDVDSAALASGTVAITSGFLGGDTLGFTANATTMGNIAGVYNTGTGLLTLTSSGATATLAQWRTALMAVTFSTPSDTPGTSRTIGWTVNDGSANSNTATTTLAVTPVSDAPTLTTIATLNGGTEDTAYDITYAALAAAADEADLEGDTISFRIQAVSTGTLTKGGSAVVAGTTLISSGDTVTWTPAANANGALNAFTVKAWDGTNASTAAVQVKVSTAAVNDPPTLTSSSQFAAFEDTPYTLDSGTFFGNLNEADPDGGTIRIRIESILNGSSVTINGAAVTPGVSLFNPGDSLTWTPPANTTGAPIYGFTVTAWDGALSSSPALAIPFALENVNDAPTLTTVSTLAGATEDTAFNIAYATLAGAADESDLDGTTPSFRIEAVSGGTLTKGGIAVVAGTTTLATGETLVWTPAAHTNGDLNAFTVKAYDGTAASSAAVQVVVTTAPVNDAPTLTSISTLTGATEDTAYPISYAMLAAASDGADIDSATLSFRIETVSSGTLTKGGSAVVAGTTTLASGESLVWTPVTNANGLLSAFTLRAWDGALASTSAIQAVVSVAAANDAPVASGDSFTVAEGGTATTLTGGVPSVLANDTDTENTTLTAAVVATTTHGSLTLNSNGTFSYTHDGSETTSDSFTYRANDGALDSNTVTVSITVTPGNDPPTLTTIATLTGASENTPFTISYATLAAAANEADIEGSAISFRIEAVSTGSLMKGGAPVAAGSSLIAAGDTVVWTPVADAFGELNAFTVRAWDGAAASGAPIQVKVFVISCHDGLTNGVETGIDCGGGVCGDCGTGSACNGAGDCVSGVCTARLCVAATCTDHVQNGTETGVDCGGAGCGTCGAGSGCVAASDCTSGVCDAAADVCVAASCADHVKNGTETAVDCGGASCAPCGSGSVCALASDCASGICRADHTCQTPSCNDGVQNDRETGIDCGGGTCIGCGNGRGCGVDSDCASLACGDDNLCAAPTCSDHIVNGTESGIDCGGTSACARCETGGVCTVASDCASGVCTGAAGAKSCQAPTCSDHVKNGLESGADCGAASTCGLCGDGAGCGSGGDCTSGVCSGGICRVPSCSDGIKNGLESDIDCGGTSTCARCDAGLGCAAASDCLSGACNAATHQCNASTCSDGLLNGSETGIDCGGSCASDCADGTGCLEADDCASGVCDPATHACAVATCGDGVRNAAETDVDCGGDTCEACDDGATCAMASDCASEVCNDTICLAPTCNDGAKNGDETDEDCGGVCAPCGDGGACGTSADCASDVCTNGSCAVPTCEDDVQNGDETGTDCGGTCSPCADGVGCAVADDCLSGVCTDGLCAVPTCEDDVHNGQESDRDCGGDCAACADGADCASADDCASGVCSQGLCMAPACDDDVHNGDETGTDCGGACGPCADGIACAAAADCTSGVCAAGICQTAACDDGVKNGAETATDCGGGCAGCPDAGPCAAHGDCASGVCTDGICQAATCDDATANGGESDVDCGGPCTACALGAGCATASDCASGVCGKGECLAATCADGVKNGDETDTDCGGSCATCGDGGDCASAGDCASGVCTDGACQEASCEDGVQNGDESDTDCGGTCGVCADGDHCTWASDCKSGVCADGVCQAATCSDGVANGSESATDCGGTCSDCADGDGCGTASDCTSGVCTGGVCQAATCGDGAKNAGESDVDCGGACGDCGSGATCTVAGDCASGLCTAGVCQTPTCSDGVMNGNESGKDCGGVCAGCADGGTCATDGDCASGVCGHGICQIPRCTDGVTNGMETGRDCGGGCNGCADGGTCAAAGDCASGVCSGNVCQAGTCDDKIHNGAETGVDCGGDCAACADGVGCADAGDCVSGVCAAGVCQAPDCADGVENGSESDVDCGGGCAPCGDTDACVTGGDCASGVCGAGVCRAAACGDGVVNGSETCDDGGLAGIVPQTPVGGDGCSATCVVEAGWSCEAETAGDPSVCATTCGDGAVGAPDEACDDANATDGDGCGATCEVEAGWACSHVAGEASLCSETCGDGALEAATEACDDGNQDADDGCSPSCTVESGWACAAVPSACTETDGDSDGVVDNDDNCPASANAGQENLDGDLMGDACDDDRDGDGGGNDDDNCPDAVNPGQADLDGDGEGDTCDDDRDGDSVEDAVEVVNGSDPEKADTDGDGLDDGVEVTGGTDPTKEDTDGDGFADGFELLAKSDPLDPDSTPSSSFIVGGAGGCAGGGNAGAEAGGLALVALAVLGLRRRARRG